MKLREAIANIDKSEKNQAWVDSDVFSNYFGLYGLGSYDVNDKLKKYWIHKWLCTDTTVGLSVYFLDDEPVAVSFQRGRKFTEEIKFISEESAKKLRDYILSMIAPEVDMFVTIEDLDQELGEPEDWQ